MAKPPPISLTAQIAAIKTLLAIIQPSHLRGAEKDLLKAQVTAVVATLEWLQENEAKIKAAVKKEQS